MAINDNIPQGRFRGPEAQPQWPDMLTEIRGVRSEVNRRADLTDAKVDKLDARVLTVEKARIAEEAGRKTWFLAGSAVRALVLVVVAAGGLVLGVFNAVG